MATTAAAIPTAQSYVERAPLPGLAGLVSAVWVQRVESGTSYRQLDIPTGGAELTCRLGRSPTVRGPSTAPVAEILRPGTTVIGVRLHPGAASAVLGVPAATVRDTAVDVAALWGSIGSMVAETVNDATDAADALRVLQGHLLVRTRWADPPDPLVGVVVRELRGNTPLTAIGDRLGISERQLRRRCEAAAGLAPKTLHRLLAVELRRQNVVQLPRQAAAWGELRLTHAQPRSGSRWTNNGEVRERGPLKHRARGESRAVPVHPELVEMLLRHLDQYVASATVPPGPAVGAGGHRG